MNYAVFTSHYFTDWILTVTTLVSFIISWTHRRHKQLFLIQIYITASLVVDLLSSLTELVFLDSKIWREIDCVSLNLFSILEITIIYLYIIKTIGRKLFRTGMKILYMIYICFCIIIWLSFPKALISNTPHLYALEGIIITVFCLLYFYELMHLPPKEEIWNKPDFWVISGLLFYFSITCPFYMLLNGLNSTPLANIIFSSFNYCLYTILFISLIKAYLCPFRVQS